MRILYSLALLLVATVPAEAHAKRANGRDATFVDGKKLFLGSSNPAGEGSEK